MTRPLTSKARQPASQATPHGPGGQPGAVQPLDVADRAERDHGHVGIEHGAVGQVGAAQPAVAVTLQRGDRDAAAQVDAVLALQSAATPPITPPSAPTSGAGPRSATVTGRSQLAAAEATSEPVNPAPMTSTRPGAGQPAAGAGLPRRRGYAATNTPSSAASASLGQRPGPHPGGDQQPVELDRLAVGEADLPAGQVQPGGGDAQPPLRVELAAPGSAVWSGGTESPRTCLDSGGRS